MKLDPYFTPCTKINSKWIHDLNVRPKTIKLLEENKGENLHVIGFVNDFLDMTPKEQETNRKTHKLDFMKNFKYFASEGTINRVKRQPTEWKKIFANDLYDKGLISRIHRELLKLNIKNQTT